MEPSRTSQQLEDLAVALAQTQALEALLVAVDSSVVAWDHQPTTTTQEQAVACSGAPTTTPQLEVVCSVEVLRLLRLNQLVDCSAALALAVALEVDLDSHQPHSLLKTTLEASVVAICLDSQPNKIHSNNHNQI